MSAVVENHNHDDHHHGPAKGFMRWLTTTNHKDIGTLYLWFSFAMFLLGGAPPNKNIAKLNHRYKVPISLWFVVVSHLMNPLAGPW